MDNKKQAIALLDSCKAFCILATDRIVNDRGGKLNDLYGAQIALKHAIDCVEAMVEKE